MPLVTYVFLVELLFDRRCILDFHLITNKNGYIIMIYTRSDNLYKSRVWLDEIPSRIEYPIQVIEIDVCANTQTDIIKRKVAIERYTPKGARYYYGLIGAEFMKSRSSSLKVQVSVGESLVYSGGSLVSHMEVVGWGLLEEYAPSIIDSIYKHRFKYIGGGYLNICCGAYSMVGTFNGLISNLTADLIKIMDSEDVMVEIDRFMMMSG